MTVVTVNEKDSQLSELLQRVLSGHEIIIERQGRPVARLLPVGASLLPRTPGNDAGKVVIHPWFDDPLPEFDV